jgi:hypothetical protein
MRRGIWVFLAICLAVSVLSGCWNPFSSNKDGGGGDPPIVYDRKSPDNLLNFFAEAYESQDGDQYEESLHDKYLFLFTSDIADSLELPPDQPWWGKTQDVQSTKKMFLDDGVLSVSMRLQKAIDWYSCTEIREHEDPPDTISGLCAQLDPDIKVTLDKGEDEPLTLWVNDSYLNVTATPDPNADDLWVVVRIEEIDKTP